MTRSESLRGISAMLVAVAAFAGMDAILKVLVGHYAPLQISALRGASSLPFVLATVALAGRWSDLRPVRIGLHLTRGVLAVIIMVGFVYALTTLSLADAYSIFLVAPLLVTAFAVPILGEHVDWRRWLAIAAGLAGVLVVLRPAGASLSALSALGALVSAVAYALSAISVRILTRSETTHSMVFWFLLLLTIFAGILAAPNWITIRSEHWAWITALGIMGSIAQHFITEAFRHAQASVIAPFEYTTLVWGAGIDWAFWDILPTPRMLLGSSMIIAAGLYLIWRERQLHEELAASIESPASGH